jgi:hypothetical protein
MQGKSGHPGEEFGKGERLAMVIVPATDTLTVPSVSACGEVRARYARPEWMNRG